MALPNSYGSTAYEVAGEERAAFLRRVLLLTCGGLGISAFASLVGLAAIAAAPGVFLNQIVMMGSIFGGWALVNFVARPMVFSGGAARWPGFLLGTSVQGLMMSFLLFVAAAVSADVVGNPFTLIGLAAGITFFTGLGLAAFAMTQRRDFSMLGAGLSAAALPAVLVMGASFVFPSVFGGTIGLLVGILFVALTVGSLLYSLNKIIHEFDTRMHVEAAYTLAIGLLVLFWNVLSLLLRLTRR